MLFSVGHTYDKFLANVSISSIFFVFRGNGNRNIGVVMNEGPKWEVNRKLMIRELKGMQCY